MGALLSNSRFTIHLTMVANNGLIRNRKGLLTLLVVSISLSSLLGCATSPSYDTASDSSDAETPTLASTPEASTAPTPAVDLPPNGDDGGSGSGNGAVPSLEEDEIEPANLTTITLGDLPEARGARYGDVRDRLIERGWLPHTFATTTGSPSDFNDSLVQEMERLGFNEVKACSGTGQGFCRFEFVHQDRTAEAGPVLVVITAAASPADSTYPEPTFWDLNLENVSDLTYLERPFDQALFAQLRENHSFCLGVGRCEPAQYMLKDALLIAGSGDFGTTKISLIPNRPISKDAALDYARILDIDSVIDFDTAQIDSELNIESYYEAGIPPEGVAEMGGTTTVRLQLTSTGMVSEISFSHIVL